MVLRCITSLKELKRTIIKTFTEVRMVGHELTISTLT